jgi:hypothetical protein
MGSDGLARSVELRPRVVDDRRDLGFREARREPWHSTPPAFYDGCLVRDTHAISDTDEGRPEVSLAVGTMTARTLCAKDADTVCRPARRRSS